MRVMSEMNKRNGLLNILNHDFKDINISLYQVFLRLKA